MQIQRISMNINEMPRILIIGTLPYNPNESSRALDTYFHNWPNSHLRMIYSNTNPPFNDFCSSYYQITDFDVFRSYFKRGMVGRIYRSPGADNTNLNNQKKERLLIKILKKKNVFRFYIRNLLWSRKRWLSNSLEKWVEEFQPEIIYLCFSDDYFILDIADYFYEKYKIPIITQIGDDYYFKKSNLFLSIYDKKYKRLFNKIMDTPGFGVYISDKLTLKYNSTFKKQGFPIYLSSTLVVQDNSLKYEFNYFGKLLLGRFKSLAYLGDALNELDKKFHINVYSSDASPKIVNYLQKHNCIHRGAIPYEEVIEKMNSGSFNIIASGFSRRDIEKTRYSLSTKVADSLLASGPIIAIGPLGDGVIDYLNEHKVCILITNKLINVSSLQKKLKDRFTLEKYIVKAKELYYQNHKLSENRFKFEQECKKLICKEK